MLMYEITLATYKVHMLHIGGLKLQKDIHPLEQRDNPVLEYVNTLETDNDLSMCWCLHSYSYHFPTGFYCVVFIETASPLLWMIYRTQCRQFLWDYFFSRKTFGWKMSQWSLGIIQINANVVSGHMLLWLIFFVLRVPGIKIHLPVRGHLSHKPCTLK